MDSIAIKEYRNGKWSVTLTLVIINLFVFIVAAFIDKRVFNLNETSSYLLSWGGNTSALTLSGEYWRLFSSVFLHVGITHVFFNIIALIWIGYLFENMFSRWLFLSVYILSGVAGGVLSVIAHRNELVISCGASGAILGLAGYLVAFSLCNKILIPFFSIARNLLVMLCVGFFLPVDNMVYLGGFIIGFILGALDIHVQFPSTQRKSRFYLIPIIMVAIIECVILIKYTDFDGRRYIMLSKLDLVLNELRTGDSGQPVEFGWLNQCIDEKIQSGNVSTSELKICGEMKGFIEEYGMKIKIRINNDLNDCLKLTNQLRLNGGGKTEAIRFGIIGDYCLARKEVIDIAFGISPDATINTEKYIEIERKLNKSIFEKQTSGKIFSEIPNLIFDVVSTGQCPNIFCRRY
ncbi:rhomboid family intramembrane serine protease [Scandinavium goeteborgense]|uniref:rhomboid family intramembrane serine protease n=1 Tax=Scandinavium goeteborgense TaxID=1851514 RepID=UPI003820014F